MAELFTCDIHIGDCRFNRPMVLPTNMNFSELTRCVCVKVMLEGRGDGVLVVDFHGVLKRDVHLLDCERD